MNFQFVKYRLSASKELANITVQHPIREFDEKLTADEYLDAFKISQAGKEMIDDGFTIYLTKETVTRKVEHLRSISR